MSQVVSKYAKQAIMDGSIDLDTDDIRIILCDNTTTTTGFDSYQYVSAALAGNVTEFDGGASRIALSSKTIDLDGTTAVMNATATFTALTAGTNPVRYVVVYKHVGADAVNPVISINGYSADQTPNGNDFLVNPSQGFLRLS